MVNIMRMGNKSVVIRITLTQTPPDPIVLLHFNVTVIWTFVNRHRQGVSVLSGSTMPQYIKKIKVCLGRETT